LTRVRFAKCLFDAAHFGNCSSCSRRPVLCCLSVQRTGCRKRSSLHSSTLQDVDQVSLNFIRQPQRKNFSNRIGLLGRFACPKFACVERPFTKHQSKPSLLMSIARMRFCLSSFFPQPARQVIHGKEGLLQVMRRTLKGGERKVPCLRARPRSEPSMRDRPVWSGRRIARALVEMEFAPKLIFACAVGRCHDL
jgi:hypothetical protein